jgi:hypothetical protein
MISNVGMVFSIIKKIIQTFGTISFDAEISKWHVGASMSSNTNLYEPTCNLGSSSSNQMIPNVGMVFSIIKKIIQTFGTISFDAELSKLHVGASMSSNTDYKHPCVNDFSAM